MSLTIALKAIDGLVLAADSRTTKGYTLDGPRTRDNSIKFTQLNDDWGALTYGLADIGRAGISSLREQISQGVSQYESLAPILDKGMEIFNRVSSDWDKRNSEIRRRERDVGFIIAGYEREEKEFRIFDFQSPEFAPRSVKNGCLLAGQWHIAKFFVNRLYTRDISVDRLKDLAVFLMNATMTVAKTVGGAIRLATITKSQGFQWVLEDEVKSITERNELFHSLFQEQLYSSLLSVVNDNRTQTVGTLESVGSPSQIERAGE